MLWLAFAYPTAALIVVGLLTLLLLWLIPKLWRFIRALLGRFIDHRTDPRREPARMQARNSADV